MLADHLRGGLVSEPGGLGLAVAMGDRVQKGTGKHVARTIGVDSRDFGSRHRRLPIPLQYDATQRAAGQANGAGQRANLAADRGQVLRAAPDLRFFFVTKQVAQVIADDGIKPGSAKVDHRHVAQGAGQGDTCRFGDGPSLQGGVQTRRRGGQVAFHVINLRAGDIGLMQGGVV